MSRKPYNGLPPEVYNRELKHKEIWKGMLSRCNDPNQPNFKSYGARGATVCDRWDPKKGGLESVVSPRVVVVVVPSGTGYELHFASWQAFVVYPLH